METVVAFVVSERATVLAIILLAMLAASALPAGLSMGHLRVLLLAPGSCPLEGMGEAYNFMSEFHTNVL